MKQKQTTRGLDRKVFKLKAQLRVALTLLGALSILSTVCHASEPSEKIVTLTAGNWRVERSVDSMTDEVTCTGYHKENRGIQLTPDILFISVPGSLRSINLRYGSNPAHELRVPSSIEVQMGAVDIHGDEFREALETNRIRGSFLTVFKDIVSLDLNTTGIAAAYDHVHAGCPIPPPSAPVKPPVSKKKSTKT